DSTIMIGLLTTLIGGEPNLKVVGQAKSAGSAIEDINTLRPDAVVVDLALENSSGFDVLEALAQRPEERRPLLAVLSNYVSPQYRAEAKRLGADYFFDKSGEIIRMLTILTELARARLLRSAS